MNSQNQYQIIAKAISYICDNYDRQPKLKDISDSVNMSKYHFQRVFKKWAGITPKDFLQFTTIEHAKKALSKGMSTLEASYTSGLSGNNRLHDLFVKIEACTPGQFKKRCSGMILWVSEIDSPFGKMAIAETEKGISNIVFGSIEDITAMNQYKEAQIKRGIGKNTTLVESYLNNSNNAVDSINLDLSGTPFQIQVWKALLSIPSSQLVSYQHLANSIQKPQAVRAVGNAVAKNPVAYFIPCHRVIKKSAEFGNYHWGKERKRIINAYEQIQVKSLQMN